MSLPADANGRRAYGEELKANPGFTSLVRLIEALLGEGGCPWDRSRKLEECPKYLRGELDEVIAAIEAGDNANLEEELGDLIFMLAFTIKLAEKEGRLEQTGVFKRILEKMVYRHPHVFGGEMEAGTPDEVLANWGELKKREKATNGDMVDCD